MRRALFALLAVIVVALAGFFALPSLKARSLGQQLLRDVTSLRERSIGRAPPTLEPIHDNGFQCLAGMLKVTPRDLSPFDKPGDLQPEAVAKELKALEPWADNLRACGESRELRFVPGAEPWGESPDLIRAAFALARVTALQNRADLTAGRAVEASLRCQATLRAAFDWSHLGAMGLVGSLGVAKQVLPECAEALNALPPQVRPDAAQTWVTLLPRAASLHELLETSRVSSAVRSFGPLSGVEGLPPAPTPVFQDSMLETFEKRRRWPEWDRAYRTLVDAPDAASRLAAAQEVDAIARGIASAASIDVVEQERRVGQLTTISLALTWLAGGAAGKPPVGERTEAGLVLQLDPPVTLPLNP